MDELFDVFDEGDGGASAGGVSDSAAAAAATEAALAAARASVPTYTPAAEPKAAQVESADTRCVWVAAAVEVQRRASPLWPRPCISGVLVGMCLQHAVGVRMALNTATLWLVSHWPQHRSSGHVPKSVAVCRPFRTNPSWPLSPRDDQ